MTTTAPATAAVDVRARVAPSDFVTSGSGVWELPWRTADVAFDELIYHWEAPLERGEGFRLYLQVRFAPGDESPWLYAGYWGKVRPVESREEPEFDRGRLALDQLLLKQKASAWRFRVVSEGARALSTVPALGVILTDNSPDQSQTAGGGAASDNAAGSPVLDIPLRHQTDIDGNRFPDRCQSAALAAAMQYYGTTVPLEQIIAFTTDPEYKSFGIWPRTLGAAHEFGFEAYLDRFRDWDSVRKTVAENKVILCSITMPKNDTYVAPPYSSISGHIVALNGVTDDGRVIVTDSTKVVGEDGYLLQWLVADFEKIWMRNKGGVGMVICPPPGAPLKKVAKVPEFPDRTSRKGDAR